MRDDLDGLRRLLGENGLLTGSDTASYEAGARAPAGRAAFVMRPASTSEVSAALAWCVARDIPVIAQSGNTGVVAASTPDGSGLQAVLSLDRLCRQISFDRTNRSVRLDAGFRLSELNVAAAREGLFFPIDLGADPAIGGMISTNTGGARFLRYGDVRRHVLGLTAVLADQAGTILRLDSTLRKNNAGVDWRQLFIGSGGSFGIVTEAVLNLEPVPRQREAVLLVPASTAAVTPLLLRLEAAFGSQLSAFEGISQEALAATLAHVPGLRNPFPGGLPPYLLLMELSRDWPAGPGEPPLSELLQDELAGMIGDGAESLLTDALFGGLETTWALRHAVPEGVRTSGRLVAMDLSFRRGDVMEFCTRMRAEITTRYPGTRVCEFGHIGDGGVHFNVVAGRDSRWFDDPDFEAGLREWIYGVTVSEYGGSFSAEHGIGRKNIASYRRYTPARLKELATGLKRLTSPGKLGAVDLGGGDEDPASGLSSTAQGDSRPQQG